MNITTVAQKAFLDYLQNYPGSTGQTLVKVDGQPFNVVWSTPSGGGVTSVSNQDNTLTISPTTGTIVASINLDNSNSWSRTQTFSDAVFNTVPTGAGTDIAATASTLAVRDANGSLTANQFIYPYATSSANPLIISAGSPQVIYQTGNGTVKLPTTSTLVVGATFTIVNTTAASQIVASFYASTLGSHTITKLLPGEVGTFVCISTAGDLPSDWLVMSRSKAVIGYTVATLPASMNQITGTVPLTFIAAVTDANTPIVGSTVVGGGGSPALVWNNGSSWTVIGV